MNLKELFSDKALKNKELTDAVANAVTTKVISPIALFQFGATAKAPIKATCIEALEFASKADPSIVDATTLAGIIQSLEDKAPRVKWESAKVIGNVIHLHKDKIDEAVKYLLANTENDGTVVRWSAAFALGQILILKTPINAVLIPACEAIVAREEKNSIKKIYLSALKKGK